jgi:hypothetical protein
MTVRRQLGVLVVLFALAWPEPATGYIGPGAGLAVIGAALAFFTAVFLGVFGFVWYPLKRLIRARRRIGGAR